MIDRDKYSLRKPTDAMKKILKENLLESDLPFTLLIEQVPGTLSEESVRKDLIEYVSREVCNFVPLFFFYSFHSSIISILTRSVAFITLLILLCIALSFNLLKNVSILPTRKSRSATGITSCIAHPSQSLSVQSRLSPNVLDAQPLTLKRVPVTLTRDRRLSMRIMMSLV